MATGEEGDGISSLHLPSDRISYNFIHMATALIPVAHHTYEHQAYVTEGVALRDVRINALVLFTCLATVPT